MARIARRVVCLGFLLAGWLLQAPPLLAGCTAKSIFVQGRVENAPPQSSVSVELVYEHGKVGESDRLILESANFRTRIPFSTQSHSVDFMGHTLGKCGRAPASVMVVLMDGDQEVDRVTLNVSRDFKSTDSSELSVREDVILRGHK